MMIGMKRLIANDDSHKKNPMIGNCTKAHRAKILDEMKILHHLENFFQSSIKTFFFFLYAHSLPFFPLKKK